MGPWKPSGLRVPVARPRSKLTCVTGIGFAFHMRCTEAPNNAMNTESAITLRFQSALSGAEAVMAKR